MSLIYIQTTPPFYLKGNDTTDNSIRITIDKDSGFAIIERRLDGIWQSDSLKTSPTSVLVGSRVKITGLGCYLAVEDLDGHIHFHAHSDFDGELSITDTKMINAYNFAERRVLQPDNSGEYVGQNFESNFYATSSVLTQNRYFQTGSIVPTTPVTIKIYESVDAEGFRIFNQIYPASNFPADSEIILSMDGFFETKATTTYFLSITSDTDFSIKTNEGGTAPWVAVDDIDVREDSMLQTKPWADGDTWTEGEYFIDSRKIYICNTTGQQDGTWEDNSELWNEIGASFSAVDTDRIVSPDTTKNLTITNTSLKHYDGTRNRLIISESESNLKSPDGDNRFKASNTNTSMIVGGSLRLVVGNSTSYLRSSDHDRGLWVKRASVALRENNKDRLWIDNLNSGIFSPNLTTYANVTNSKVELTQAGNNRIKIDANYTNIYSPDGGNLNIGNAGVFYNGAIVQMSTHKGVADGLAELDESGIVPTSQLPAYVDAIDEYADLATLISTDPQEANKVYITVDDSKVYRYTGTPGSYAEISPTLVLGTTNTTAYRGDRGLIAYDHSQLPHDYEPADSDIVKAPLGVLPVLDGSNLTGIAGVGDISAITSPDETKTLTLTNADLKYNDGLIDRADFSAVHTKFYSPDGGYTLIDDSQYLYNDGTRNRLEINSAGAMLVSPGGSHSLIVGNTGAFYDGSEIITVGDVNISNWDAAYGWGDHDGLYSLTNHEHDDIISPDTLKDLTLSNANLLYQDGNYARLYIDAVESRLTTPNGQEKLVLSNGALEYYDGTRNRIDIDDTVTGLLSPDGAHNLAVDNTGAFYDGAEIITAANLPVDNITSPDELKDLTITNTNLTYDDGTTDRIEIDSTQTRLRGTGATPIYIKFGSSSFEINDGVDRFMSNSSKSVMASPNDIWWSACYDDKYEVMDDTKSRIIVSGGATQLFPAGDKGHLTINDTGLWLSDGARTRLQIIDTDSYIFSPNGQKWVKLDNTEITLQGDTVINGNVTAVGSGVGLRVKQNAADVNTYIDFYEEGSVRKAWFGFGSSGNRHGLFIHNDYSDGDIRMKANNNERLILEQTRTLIYNQARSRYLSLTATSNNTSHAWSVTSDKKLKENINPLDNDSIEFINNLKPVSYSLKTSPNKTSMGFISQDVELIQISDIVGDDGESKSLAYTEIIAPLVIYVQDLQKQINELGCGATI